MAATSIIFVGSISSSKRIMPCPSRPEPAGKISAAPPDRFRYFVSGPKGSDSLLVHAPGTARPMTPWHVLPVCCSKGDENIMVTHTQPERRERPTGRTGLDG